MAQMWRMGAFACWMLLAIAAASLQVFHAEAAHHDAENDQRVSQHNVAVSVVSNSWSSQTANALHVQPNATPSFQAGVIRATQLSFSEAPDRYPFILEQILNATHAAATTPLP